MFLANKEIFIKKGTSADITDQDAVRDDALAKFTKYEELATELDKLIPDPERPQWIKDPMNGVVCRRLVV